MTRGLRHRGLWLCHGTLLMAGLAAVLVAGSPWPWRIAGAVLVAAPLLAAIPGLLQERRYTYQWLTVVLVLYVGAAAVEVVATLGAAALGGVVLLASLVELALLLRLIRRATPPAPRAPHE